ncbi:hypothetical protein ACFLWG_00045 [Chloroflexota bacterium]
MRSRIVLLIIAVLVLDILIASSCMKVSSGEDLYGVWQGEHHEMELLFIFNSDGTCSLSFKNNDSGETNELSGTFEVDFEKSPIPLSIRNIPQLTYGLYTIIYFTDNNSLIMADFSPRWRLRPISFQNNTSMNLRRVL